MFSAVSECQSLAPRYPSGAGLSAQPLAELGDLDWFIEETDEVIKSVEKGKYNIPHPAKAGFPPLKGDLIH